MNKAKYLQRIGYTGSLEPNLQVLSALQKAHLLHIPFENLDIHNKVPIELDINKRFHKIIENNRGGFCYELNGLFFELLQLLGFNARIISARVYDKNKGYGKDFDHLAITVNSNGVEYLTDVGFGEFAFAPLKLETAAIQHDERGDFVIDKYDKEHYRVSKLENEIWVPQYIFSNKSRAFHEFGEMCLYHQTSPESHFTQNRLISRPTADGRITISQNTLKIKQGDTTRETTLENEEAFNQALLKYFNISGQTEKQTAT